MKVDPDIFGEFGDKVILSTPNHRKDIELFSADIQLKSFSAHVHEGFVIGVVEKGIQRFNYRGNIHQVGPNTIIMLNPDEIHSAAPIKGNNLVYKTIHLPPEIVSDFISPEFIFNRVSISSPRLSNFLIHHLLKLQLFESPLSWDEKLLLFTDEFFNKLSDIGGFKVADINVPYLWIKELLGFIDKNLDGSLTVEILANKIGLSKYHFIRKFKETVGFTPHSYIQSRRTNMARKMLISAAKPVDVAAALGFTDQSHLNKWLVSSYGATPGFFLKKSNKYQHILNCK